MSGLVQGLRPFSWHPHSFILFLFLLIYSRVGSPSFFCLLLNLELCIFFFIYNLCSAFIRPPSDWPIICVIDIFPLSHWKQRRNICSFRLLLSSTQQTINMIILTLQDFTNEKIDISWKVSLYRRIHKHTNKPTEKPTNA